LLVCWGFHQREEIANDQCTTECKYQPSDEVFTEEHPSIVAVPRPARRVPCQTLNYGFPPRRIGNT